MTKDDLLTFDGTTQPVTEWALDYGIPAGRIIRRLARGWTVDLAITEPVIVSADRKLLPDTDQSARRGKRITRAKSGERTTSTDNGGVAADFRPDRQTDAPSTAQEIQNLEISE